MHEFSVQSSLKEALDDNVIDCALGPLYINVNSSANGGSSSMSLEVVTLKSSRHQMSHRRSALQEKDAEKGCSTEILKQTTVSTGTHQIFG
ncbi:GL21441 [Drosophila persimilis]|uniref:GL21441 n=1 Tax=Drosophila persimilis TaxID=7234 RepID=B4IRT6_DROPE|nr:GL21441 [Drosophila persimilis]